MTKNFFPSLGSSNHRFINVDSDLMVLLRLEVPIKKSVFRDSHTTMSMINCNDFRFSLQCYALFIQLGVWCLFYAKFFSLFSSDSYYEPTLAESTFKVGNLSGERETSSSANCVLRCENFKAILKTFVSESSLIEWYYDVTFFIALLSALPCFALRVF